MTARSNTATVTPPGRPDQATQRLHAQAGSDIAYQLASHIRQGDSPTLLICDDAKSLHELAHELGFYLGHPEQSLDGFGDFTAENPLLVFPGWEVLPYDAFSPHQDLISQRLLVLSKLPNLRSGALLVTVADLMQQLPPRSYIDGHGLVLKVGDRLDPVALRTALTEAGYLTVSQVLEHGQLAVRGGLIDIFPMGSDRPLRIELFDDEVESLRDFDPESQRSVDRVDAIELLPAREFPRDEAALQRFYSAYQAHFQRSASNAWLYRELKSGHLPAGIEFYLPLFFERTATLFDYLPPGTEIVYSDKGHDAAEHFWREVGERYQLRGGDPQRPALPPTALYLPPPEVFARIKQYPALRYTPATTADPSQASQPALDIGVDSRGSQPLQKLQQLHQDHAGRILLVAQTLGRREVLLEFLGRAGLKPTLVPDWPAFLASDAKLCLTVGTLDRGMVLSDPALVVITEAQIYGVAAPQRRREKARSVDAATVIRDLSELRPGDAIVHLDHGVGRYLGLEIMTAGGVESEYLTLEYAGGDKVYVPIASLELIHRYVGAPQESLALNKLGTPQWQRATRKARQRAADAAAELLEIYARRAARSGHSLSCDEADYQRFVAAFPFEETPDQEQAILQVKADLASPTPMDRVVCGDVGFGKTEVAMRAAFIAAMAGKQVVVLVPTTLLAQQHAQNFQDRFTGWPLRIAGLSRFQSAAEQKRILAQLADGTLDIVIGTHRLLNTDVAFHDLGLVIIDEEHRFGVRQKERMKALRAEIDILTLTATPIPRTLNLSLSGLRDLSIIATPPERRLAIRTFVRDWSPALVQEACHREFGRGGQVYLLHNRVDTMERTARDLEKLLPEARIRYAHGQMSERQLEQIMLDFYHQRFDLLVCSTIIESGIDVPNANTIIIDRADKLGLAQLHQLRGRVGRSHHQAYAYLTVPSREGLKGDALKRLEAIETLGELGIGFTLATHDMEIRGAGELLGQEQSGRIEEVGFTLYNELLERAVADIRAGRTPDSDPPVKEAVEVNLQLPGLLPADYVPDIHLRLVLYKRIASASDTTALTELQVECVDRFGLLPQPARNLFALAELKQQARQLGVVKITGGEDGVTLVMDHQPGIDVAAMIEKIQRDPAHYRFDGKRTLRVNWSLDPEEGPLARVTAVHAVLDALTPAGSRRPSVASA